MLAVALLALTPQSPALFAPQSASQLMPSLVWTLDNAGHTGSWYFHSVSVGSSVTASVGPAFIDVPLAGPPPVLSPHTGIGLHPMVDGHFEIYDAGMSWVTVSHHGPEWSYQFPAYSDRVAIRAGGSGAVAFAGAQLAAFDSVGLLATGTAPFTPTNVAYDGSTLLLIAGSSVRILAVPSFAVVYSGSTGAPSPTLEPVGTVAVSGDVAAIGRVGGFDVLRRTAGVWSFAWSYSDSPASYCSRLAVSDDSSRIVAGFCYSDNDAHIRVIGIDSVTQATTLNYDRTGLGTRPNMIEAVSVSANGRVVAVGCWGDGSATTPQLVFLNAGTGAVIGEVQLGGSVGDLDLSVDGSLCAVGWKDRYAGDWTPFSALSVYAIPRTIRR